MKKYLFIIFVCGLMIFTSCTENKRSRVFGTDVTISLPKGEKLIEATWKGDDLFYLTEPMEDDYKPKTKIFREKSSYGFINSKVIFIESK